MLSAQEARKISDMNSIVKIENAMNKAIERGITDIAVKHIPEDYAETLRNAGYTVGKKTILGHIWISW